MNVDDLDAEADEIAKLLYGKRVSKVFRPRPKEIVIEFEDGERLFVNETGGGLDFSITGT